MTASTPRRPGPVNENVDVPQPVPQDGYGEGHRDEEKENGQHGSDDQKGVDSRRAGLFRREQARHNRPDHHDGYHAHEAAEHDPLGLLALQRGRDSTISVDLRVDSRTEQREGRDNSDYLIDVRCDR